MSEEERLEEIRAIHYRCAILAKAGNGGYPIADVMKMIPFERDIHLQILQDLIEKEKEALENNKSATMK